MSGRPPPPPSTTFAVARTHLTASSPRSTRVAAEAGDQRDLLLFLLPIGQQHGHRRGLAAKLVDHLPQLVGPARHFGNHHLHAGHRRCLGNQLIDARAALGTGRRLLLQLANFA